MIGTLLVIGKEKEQEYKGFMETVACAVHRASVDGIKRMRENHSDKEVIENSKAIGAATGQIVLDKVIDITKDMSREELLEYVTESSAQAMVMVMNKNPAYRMKIGFLASFEAKQG